ncbi:germination protein YpeB [Thermaerobacillus caldiproteolyticus]|uniref:Spore germination protein n=1 Tax=Thermaerobacillus caldiproteolyticus TaxID=247480 RepID=A0A7W0BYH9_9BACL|nr:germination protein YpeB [Anoxybacillus caldiproteolyticus]MBA2875003.1 spore germination protein [Anoxybacillus caldiproteolyticus]QPA33011.1 germination protein YpeB [Anoxybacillus caldiproteolyticus]
MLRVLLIGVLSLGVVGTAYWGYREHQEKNAVLLHAENNYQRAFHDLTYQIDLLHDKIGTTLAMNSRASLSPALAEVWRIASEAHSDVGQLPLSLLPFNKTQQFLAQIGEFSYRTAIRDLEKEPLTKGEYQTLRALYKSAANIQQELRNVQHLVLQNNLRWMDVELALATEKQPSDNIIIDGFKAVEKNVESADFGPTFTSLENKEKGFVRVSGKSITKEEAKHVAVSFLGLKGTEKIKVVRSGKGADERFYSLTIHDPKTNADTYIDITEKGGYPIWVIDSRPIKKQKISVHEAAVKGMEFLKKHKFTNLELYDSTQYDNVAVLTFVTNENGVRIYPEAIKMKVALDDGKIVGFSARDYLSSNIKRPLPKPALTVEQARTKINPNLKVMEQRQAIITNDMNQEVLCYEFLGTLGDDTYQIFVNAKTGTEEKVEKLQGVEQLYD